MRILVVESNPVIALNLQTLVLDLGQRPVGPAETLEEVERLIAHMRIDAAIIDVGEGDEERLGLGRRMSEQHISVIFSTTQPVGTVVGAPDHACVLRKPYSAAEIRFALSELIDEHQTYADGMARDQAKRLDSHGAR